MMDFDDEDECYDFEGRVKAVSKMFRNAPHNTVEELEKLGFTYMVDDSETKEAIAEEKVARPINEDQEVLVRFFESKDLPDETMLNIWQEELLRDDPNYSLWRRYFRQSNAQLKRLILFGLDCEPTSEGLLNALSFLHEFSPMLKELITRYLIACDQENNEIKFMERAQDFDSNTGSSGYDALQELVLRYANGTFKARCIADLITQRAAQGGERF